MIAWWNASRMLSVLSTEQEFEKSKRQLKKPRHNIYFVIWSFITMVHLLFSFFQVLISSLCLCGFVQ